MPRVSILDSILNRPSQSYAPPDVLQDDARRGGSRSGSTGRWAAPPDLPSAPRAPSSILSGGGGGVFRKRSNRNSTMMGSDAGTSVAGSTSSRFGRSRRFSKQPGDSTMETFESGSQYAPSSIADGSVSKKKSHWWEAGSMTFGRRSRPPSIAGDSVFSEPPDRPMGSANQWAGMAGVGAGGNTNRGRVARSEYGGVNTRNAHSLIVPPVPRVDNKYLNGAPQGRLQSNVAPLGFSSINPSLTAKPSKQRLDNRPQGGIARSNSTSGRVSSPPPSIQHMSSPPTSQIMFPPNRISSPILRPQSPAMSESGRSIRSAGSNMQSRAQEWRDFVQNMSNSEISKTWQSSQSIVSNIDAALQKTNASNTVERRRSNVVRLQKELQQEAQYEQVIRDPGVIHQDLLARAASQIVGPPPASRHDDADLLASQSLRPGSVLSPGKSIERVRSPPVQQQYQQQQQSQPQQQSQQYYQQQSHSRHPLYAPQQPAVYHQSGSMSPPARAMSPVSSPPMSPSSKSRTILPLMSPTCSQNPLPSSIPVPPIIPMPVTQIQETSEEETSSEEESDEEEGGESVETSGNKTTEDTSEEVSEEEEEEEMDSIDSEESRKRLEAVNEEDEEASSVGHEMRAPRTMQNTTTNASKYQAFEKAMKSNGVVAKQVENPMMNGHVSPAQKTTPDASPLPSTYQLQPVGRENEPMQGDQGATEEADHHKEIIAPLENAPAQDTSPISVKEPIEQTIPTDAEAKSQVEEIRQGSTEAVQHDVISQETENEAISNPVSPPKEESEGIVEARTQEAENQNKNSLIVGAPSALLEDSHSSKSQDRSESQSIRTIQTGKGTVTFDAAIPGDDKKSIDSNATASRPKSALGSLGDGTVSRQQTTLPKKLSDVSLGTAFGINASALRGASRASSRGVFSPDSENVSTRSNSDEEVDGYMHQRIKDEQKRLRNMKVGDNFFGGSFSSLIDKFGVADHELPTEAAQGGSSSTPTIIKDGKPLTSQEHSTMNAQESIDEGRRLRAESPTMTRGKRDSDVMTTTSAIAPSFAAVWLLNQMDGSPQQATTPDSASALAPAEQIQASSTIKAESQIPQSSDEMPLSTPDTTPSKKGHSRQNSKASSNDNTPASHVSATSRFRNFFGGGSSTNGLVNDNKKQSVMDRPRQKKSKSREAGPPPLTTPYKANSADASSMARVETISDLTNSDSLSQIRDSSASASTSSPLAPTVSSSKDKPAPKKSALKPKKQKSLADTLFSFGSPEKRRRNSEAKKVEESMRLKKQSTAEYVDALEQLDGKREGRNAIRARPSSESMYTTPSSRGFHTASGESSPERNLKPAQEASTELGEIEEENVLASRAASFISPSEKMQESALVTAPATVDEPLSASTAPATVTATADTQEIFERADSIPTENVIPIAKGAGSEEVHPIREELTTAGSEMGSGESPISTVPTTPGTSERIEKLNLPQAAADEEIPNGMSSPMTSKEKSITLPPVSDFVPAPSLGKPGNDYQIEMTEPSLKPETVQSDTTITPMAEVKEPTFGINLIPPTPPALESRNSCTSAVSKASKGTPDTVMEAAEDDDNEEVASSLQRDTSIRSKSSELTKKPSKKKKTKEGEVSEIPVHGLQAPKGLIATPRRHQSEDIKTDELLQKKKSKGKKSIDRLSRSYAVPVTVAAETPSPPRSVSSATFRDSIAEAPPVPAIPTSSSNLTIPSSRSDTTTNSSNGSDSIPYIQSNGSRSPAPSTSGRSAASIGFTPDMNQLTYQQQPLRNNPRKIRTLTAGPNGHARTSLMSAISETNDGSSSPLYRSQSPMPDLTDSPMAASLADHSQSSNNTRSSSPSLTRPLPPASAISDAFMTPAGTLSQGVSSRAGSADGHGAATGAWRASYMSQTSDLSGLNGTPNGLILPSAPQGQTNYKAKEPPKLSSAIDERLYAKTTMSTAAVTSGAFKSKSLKKRKSNLELHGLESARHSRVSVDTMPDELMEELQRTQINLTSHTPPPRKLSSTQILVQVVTCAIDEIDRQLLKERIRSENAYGFVPGRSFCGRVMETGWEVKRLRKGDAIFGLQNSRKCGALAEFMIIDQGLVCKAPEDCLTAEEIAALPAVGVMAYQTMELHCSQLKRGSRILILNAHDGVGLLTMQEASSLGLIIVAQCPGAISDGVALCEANGAHEVVIGDPLWALNSLHESSFDLVLDTVGGRRIYDAARRILAFEGEFVTCIGDLQTSVNPNLKSHFRSLKRSFFKKDTKRVGYEWISTDMGEDCREALEAVKAAAERGQICPRLQSILSFGEAPRAFESALRGGPTEPGSIVVRIS